MTKEELKEAIASTIVENGQKGITAQALANILNEIVDAAGEGGGGGGVNNVLQLDLGGYVGPNEHNAQIYEKIITGAESNIFYQIVAGALEEGTIVSMQSSAYLYLESFIAIVFVDYITGDTMIINLNPDGSLLDA